MAWQNTAFPPMHIALARRRVMTRPDLRERGVELRDVVAVAARDGRRALDEAGLRDRDGDDVM